ncbi:hypothetical protein RyT2_25010 [Pseudolactococcus yaeyamensis]
MIYHRMKENYMESTVKKNIKWLLLALLVFVSVGTHHVSAETTHGEFQVGKNPPATSTPPPTSSLPTTDNGGGSGVVSSDQLPMTGEQVFVWTLFAGLLLVALVLLILVMRKRKEQQEVQTHHQS